MNRLKMDSKTRNSASISLLAHRNKSKIIIKHTLKWLSLHTNALRASYQNDQVLPASLYDASSPGRKGLSQSA